MGTLQQLKLWYKDLISVIYPALCEVCDSTLVHGEEAVCLDCLMNLPRCNIHNDPFNTMHQRLMGHAPIERAAAYFHYYRESKYTRLIHAAKYSGRPRIAELLANRFASEISGDRFFDGIDLIIPVPLHKTKIMKRGYNQSFHIALGLSRATGIGIGDNLIATRSHTTQTKHNSYTRWLNSQNIYEVQNQHTLTGKHILIVDDVLTTGATLLACCEAIHKAEPSAKISVLTLALTQLQ